MRSVRAAVARVTVLACLVGAGHGQEGIPLRDVAALAKVRAERADPPRLAALEQHLADLRSDYRRNSEVLDKTIEKVVALGDTVFPLLVDALSPADGEAASRFLAENSARVLARLSPENHLPLWIEFAQSEDHVSRRMGLRLLGASKSPDAVPTIVRLFDRLGDGAERLEALDAAERIGTPALAPRIAPLLRSSDSDLRQRALLHLTRTAYSDAVPLALDAIRNERENALLRDYIEFFRVAAVGNETVADALSSLVTGVRLDASDLERLVRALASIAPEGHKPTRAALLALLERGEIGSLGVQAALTLQALGEKRGRKILFDLLDERVKRNRNEATPLAERADAQVAFGNHREAIRDYELAIRFGTVSTRKQYYSFQIARCEAHSNNGKKMLEALRESGLPAATIRREAAGDAKFEELLEKLKKDVDALGR